MVSRTIMIIFEGDADHEVFQVETECVPRVGEIVVVADLEVDEPVRKPVARVEWYFAKGRMPQAHVYLWPK